MVLSEAKNKRKEAPEGAFSPTSIDSRFQLVACGSTYVGTPSVVQWGLP